MTVLVGDVGGTHTRLALARIGDGRREVRRKRTYPSAEHPGLGPIVERYLSELDTRPERAVFAVACPVVGGACELPNLHWTLEEERLAEEVGIPGTRVINDFDAVCHSLRVLGPGDLVPLQEGEERATEARAVLGAGTGLGVGFVTSGPDAPRVHASEGGHAGFAPRTPEEWQLAEFLRERYGRASWERVLSGPGLVDIYRFLVESGRGREVPGTRAAMDRGDSAAVISDRALDEADPTCERALHLFVSAYGARAGDLALTLQALGGVYVAGGIAPKILPALRDGPFLDAFRDKGRFGGFVSRIPVRVITNAEAGLLGAAAAAGIP